MVLQFFTRLQHNQHPPAPPSATAQSLVFAFILTSFFSKSACWVALSSVSLSLTFATLLRAPIRTFFVSTSPSKITTPSTPRLSWHMLQWQRARNAFMKGLWVFVLESYSLNWNVQEANQTHAVRSHVTSPKVRGCILILIRYLFSFWAQPGLLDL